MWYSVTVYWKDGCVQTIWVKDEQVAWAITNNILEQHGEFIEKIRITPAR